MLMSKRSTKQEVMELQPKENESKQISVSSFHYIYQKKMRNRWHHKKTPLRVKPYYEQLKLNMLCSLRKWENNWMKNGNFHLAISRQRMSNLLVSCGSPYKTQREKITNWSYISKSINNNYASGLAGIFCDDWHTTVASYWSWWLN